MELSRTQKIIRWFTSRSLFEKMMSESKQWSFDCDCGKTSSIWDIGGIRYGSRGKSLTGVKCPHCKKFSMRKIYKQT